MKTLPPLPERPNPVMTYWRVLEKIIYISYQLNKNFCTNLAVENIMDIHYPFLVILTFA